MTDINAVLKAFPVGAMRCNGFDVGTVVRELIAAAPTPPQPIYDDSKERSACRKEWEQRNKLSHFEPVPFPDYWAGWKDSAQSRAKSGHAEQLRAEVNRLHEAAEFAGAVSQGIEVALRAQLADACTMLKEIRHHGYHSHKRDGQIDSFLSTIANTEADHE